MVYGRLCHISLYIYIYDFELELMVEKFTSKVNLSGY